MGYTVKEKKDGGGYIVIKRKGNGELELITDDEGSFRSKVKAERKAKEICEEEHTVTTVYEIDCLFYMRPNEIR